VLKGVMINKDVTHAKMRRYIENPRIVLLDCSLEYKKGESQTNVEIIGEQDFTRMLQIEEEYVQRICADIIAVKPDLVFTEKGVSDLAQHYLLKAGITAIRRGEMLAAAEPFLQQQIHPTVIIRAFREALEDIVGHLQSQLSITLDVKDKAKMADVVKACVGTKFIGKWSDLAVKIALDAVETVTLSENGRLEVDIKR